MIAALALLELAFLLVALFGWLGSTAPPEPRELGWNEGDEAE